MTGDEEFRGYVQNGLAEVPERIGFDMQALDAAFRIENASLFIPAAFYIEGSVVHVTALYSRRTIKTWDMDSNQ